MAKAIEVIARGLLLRDGRILACRNDAVGYYYLPGGHVEFGEAASVAVLREFVEECGLEVEVGDVGIVTEVAFGTGKKAHHEVNLVFHVKHPTKHGVKSLEHGISFHWIEIAALVDVDLRPAAIKAWLLEGGRSGLSWASEFDIQDRA